MKDTPLLPKDKSPPESPTTTIRDVWVHNFFEELGILSSYIEQNFNVIAFVSIHCIFMFVLVF